MAVYICIDLKSFYASVECVERCLDPLNTNLVVADAGRTEKTICLAVTPALKQYGIPGRARLFEVIETVRRVNAQRLQKLSNHEFTGKSCLASELGQNPSLQLDFVIAPPQMAHYMEISTKIYEIYLRYIAPEDIHVYSIDEVFIDATGYLKTYHCTPQELARKMIREVLQETGVTATAGIGTNLYLAKIAMDIVAKKIPADENGVRIAELDEMSYRKKLWSHTPLTDFWRIGNGYAKRLEKMQIFTMGDLARFSEHGEDLLFRICPVTGFEVKMQVLHSRNNIVGRIHGCRRTSHIIISPAIPARSVHPAGKIHDIKVSERFHFVCHRLRIPVIMRPASRTFMQIAGIIAQGRIESSKKLDTRV